MKSWFFVPFLEDSWRKNYVKTKSRQITVFVVEPNSEIFRNNRGFVCHSLRIQDGKNYVKTKSQQTTYLESLRWGQIQKCHDVSHSFRINDEKTYVKMSTCSLWGQIQKYCVKSLVCLAFFEDYTSNDRKKNYVKMALDFSVHLIKPCTSRLEVAWG